MHSYKIDVAVLLIFFARPEQFSKVFEQVKIARPSKLFLYQDGPREGRKDDIIGIKKCRQIAEDIDWECEVYRYYQEENVGCDPSEFIAQKWAFSIVDKCIVLEDDDVATQSFFPFCKELLDRYENDNRINIISGMNHLEKIENSEESYHFTTLCSIWGWASWKRVIDTWDASYSFMEDKTIINKMNFLISKDNNLKNVLKECVYHKSTGKAHYETILASNMFLNNRVNIVPTVNMISNIGIASESTHSTDSIEKLPTGIRRVFNMKTYEITFPLKHPKYVLVDMDFQRKVMRIMGWNHPWVQRYRKFESLFIKIKNREFKKILNKILKKSEIR